MHIDVVSDVICPWCFIGKRRLERALALRPELTVDLTWRAFELNPDLPSNGIPLSPHLSTKFGNSRTAERLHAGVSAAGRAEGIKFAFERIRRIPNTFLAHRLIRLAGGEDRSGRLVEALFRAYFLEGLEIGDIEVLTELAARVGLDPTKTRQYLIGDDGTSEVRAEEVRARRLGIHAVPYFIIERGYAISGAQEPEMFLPMFDIAAGIVGPVALEA